MQTVIGIRELRAHLSAYLRRVKAGETVIITERGKRVGRIIPYGQSVDAQMGALESAGLIAWNGRELPRIEPSAQIQGQKTVSELLLENRE